MLALPLGTLYAMVARHQIPHVRLGPRLVRFRREEIERWLEGKVGGGTPSGPAPTSTSAPPAAQAPIVKKTPLKNLGG